MASPVRPAEKVKSKLVKKFILKINIHSILVMIIKREPIIKWFSSNKSRRLVLIIKGEISELFFLHVGPKKAK